MRSNVCKIEKGEMDIQAILRESEKVAIYNDLNRKQTLHLRLLCEDLSGMLPAMVGDFAGKLWIDFEENICKVNVAISIDEISADRRKELLGIAKNKKNAAAVGVVGKIRSVVEGIFLNDDLADVVAMPAIGIDAGMGYDISMDYSQYWSLNQYKNSVKNENKEDAWDELEKSVIASVADDVIVGIKGREVNIIIVKHFG